MSDLKAWIKKQLDSGYSQEQILQSLLKAGYSEVQARRAIQEVLNQRKEKNKITISYYKPLIYLLILLLIILFLTGGYLYASGGEKVQNPSTSSEPFTEKQCMDLLANYDSSVREMTFKDKYLDFDILGNILDTQFYWRINVSKIDSKANKYLLYIDKEPLSGRHVFSVGNNKSFQGCCIVTFNPIEKSMKNGKHYRCPFSDIFLFTQEKINYIYYDALIVTKSSTFTKLCLLNKGKFNLSSVIPGEPCKVVEE
ncbi:MAG: hypothetical protein J7K87_03410 [Candidatus Aenigmarchaeota archaeon]|nr:hypothetical protein [Candidatus Aenigmarchaeota archaeon]